MKTNQTTLSQKMKEELISKLSIIVDGLISDDELEIFCDNLANIYQKYTDELLNYYYSKNYHDHQSIYSSQCINIIIPMNFHSFQNFSPINHITSMQNSYIFPNSPYQPFTNHFNQMGNPYIPIIQPYQMHPPTPIQNSSFLKVSSISKQSHKAKSKKSDSKHYNNKKKDKHQSKKDEKSKSKHNDKIKSKSSKKQPEEDSNATIKTFNYHPDDQFNGIINSFPRSSRDKDILVDSSSEFVPGFGYPRNVFPGGSYFKGSEDDEDFWLRFDFQKKLIEISSYTLYSDNIKSWNIEISNDGNNWEVIDQHSDYTSSSVKTNFQVQRKKFVRYCRIHQTGPCSDDETVKINTIEFFGRIKIDLS